MDGGADTRNCNEMLLQAVRTSNVEEVERWLQHPDLNVKYNIGGGDTILLESIRVGHELIFLSLLNAGFEVNVMNEMQATPLGRAVHSSANNFVHELLKRGADINTPCVITHFSQHLFIHYTPLEYAVFFENLDTVSLLLYYGADVNPVCIEDETYLMCAVRGNNFEISKILLNYENDLSTKSRDGTTALELAIQVENPIAVDILNLVANKTESLRTLMRTCLRNNSNEFFKLILFKYEKQSNLNEHFLLNYLFDCRCPNSEWVECLHLFFTVACCSNVHNRRSEIFFHLLLCFHKRQLELPDRMPLIYLFLSYGVVITYLAVNLAYLLYGFNEELEAFLYAFNYTQSVVPTNFLPVPKFIFTLEDDYSIIQLFNKHSLVFKQLLSNLHYYTATEHLLVNAILKSIGICSLSGFQKRAIIKFCREHVENIEHIMKRLAATPKFPSLVELCRNQTRKFIKQQYNISKPYQFLAIVKGLNLPVHIKDVICFKTAIYN